MNLFIIKTSVNKYTNVYYFTSRKLQNHTSEFLEFYMFPLRRISIFLSVLIWTNGIVNTEEYRILTWIQNFVNYDIVISDQSWCYNIIILTRKFYAFSLSLPRGDLDLVHRILYVWILNIEFWIEHRILWIMIL